MVPSKIGYYVLSLAKVVKIYIGKGKTNCRLNKPQDSPSSTEYIVWPMAFFILYMFFVSNPLTAAVRQQYNTSMIIVLSS